MTSGQEPIGGGDALAPVLGLADHVEVLEELQEPAQAAPDDRVVVDQQDPDRPLFVSHDRHPLPILGCIRLLRSVGSSAGSMHQRKDSFGLGDVTQTLRTEVAEQRALAEVAAQLDRPCCRRGTSPRRWRAPGALRRGRAGGRSSGRP